MLRGRMVLCAAVILIAPTLREPWMIAAQAGLGGIMLGFRLAEYLDKRTSSERG